MSQTLNINGTNYLFPETGEINWGQRVTNWAVAITAGTLQKKGGSFTLTAEVDFGGTYGHKLSYVKSQGTNLSTTGVLRLANTEGVGWRNSANGADLLLKPNVSTDGILQYNSVDLVDVSSTQSISNKTFSNPVISGLTASRALQTSLGGALEVSLVTSTELGRLSGVGSQVDGISDTRTLTNKSISGSSNTLTNIAYASLVLTGALVNGDVSASAAIALSKLAALTVSRALVSDGSGVVSVSSVTSTELGYLSGVTGAIQTALDAKTLKSTLTTKGDLYVATGAGAITRLAVGSDGTVLTADSAQASGYSFTSPLINPMDSAGDLIVGGASGAATKLDSGTAEMWLVCKGAASPSWTNTVTTGKTIDGSADEVQLLVQGHSTQTNNILLVEKSDGTDLFKVSNAGDATILGLVLAGDGSASTPGFSFASDPDTGMYRNSAGNQLDFTAGGTRRLSLNATRAQVDVPMQVASASAATPAYSFSSATSTGLYLPTAGTIGFSAAGTAVMEAIAGTGNNGQVNIGAAAVGAGALGFNLWVHSSTTGVGLGIKNSTTSGSATAASFYDGATTLCGSIIIDTTLNTTSYATTSDERLKANFESFNGLDMIKRVAPTQYERHSSPGKKEIGFSAQELHAVFPQAVHVGGNNPESEPWMIDYSKLVTIVWKGLQETETRVEYLEQQLARLEQQLAKK